MNDTQTLADTICDDIDAARGELVDLCDKLVAAPSVNPPGRTTEVAAAVRSYLSGHGLTTKTVKVDDEAPNVVAEVDGQSSGRHVVFNGHMDTMEAGHEVRLVGSCLQAEQGRGPALRPRHGKHERRVGCDVPRDHSAVSPA